jgi:hypothetical protein
MSIAPGFGTPARTCRTWKEVTEILEAFPSPLTAIDYDVGVTSQAWVFRGSTHSSYPLRPAIEREAEREAESKSMGWAALEVLVLNEFKSRAPMHLTPLATPRDELTWLALMQHYGIAGRKRERMSAAGELPRQESLS